MKTIKYVDDEGKPLFMGLMRMLTLGLPPFAPDELDLAITQALEKAKAEVMKQENETHGYKR